MSGRHWLAVLCLLAGVPLAAWGLANGWLLVGLAGLALVLAFVALAMQWLAGADRPPGTEKPIRPAADPAWAMKDQPVQNEQKR